MTIQEIREEIQKQQHREAKYKELMEQKNHLAQEEAELRAVWQKEEYDVSRMEAGSFSGFLYSLLGKKEQMLDKEKQEAYAAAVKHRTVLYELQAVEKELEQLSLHQKPMEQLKQQLDQAVKEQTEKLKASSPQKAEQLLEAEQEIALLNSQKKEIKEAVAAGNKAKELVKDVKKSLDSAQNWGTWDMLGGGFIANVAKHSHLDSAQQKIDELQTCLLRFRTELADVKLDADIQIGIDGFLQFADYFWDSFLADWAVQNKIEQARTKTVEVEYGIIRVLGRLQEMETDYEERLIQKKNWLENYIEE